jgi:hypothetical protein
MNPSHCALNHDDVYAPFGDNWRNAPSVVRRYKVYHKTWIDGVDGTMFWKRGVMVHSSRDFMSWAANPGKLCVYPDEMDGDNAYLPTHDRTGRLSSFPVLQPWHIVSQSHRSTTAEQRNLTDSEPMPNTRRCRIALRSRVLSRRR